MLANAKRTTAAGGRLAPLQTGRERPEKPLASFRGDRANRRVSSFQRSIRCRRCTGDAA